MPTKRLPPGPTAIPIIGHLHLLGPLPHQAFHKLSTCYGPLVHLRLGSIPIIVASDSDTAKEILNPRANFTSRPVFSTVHHLTYGSADFIFVPYGPSWKFMKKLCMLELLGSHTLELMQPVRWEEVQRLLRLLLSKSQKREAVDMGKELIMMANNMTSRMALSWICFDSEREPEELQKLLHEVALLAGNFNLSDYNAFCRNLDS